MLTEDFHRHTFHEIKNSITILSSSLDLLRREDPKIASLSGWNNICEELSFLNTIITDYRCLAIPTAPLQSVDVSAILKILAIRMKPFADTCGCPLKITAPEHLPTILANQTQLLSCLVNLVKNAMEASSNTPVLLTLKESKDSLAFLISDNGCGIPDEIASTIFDPYVTTKKYGTGLGLFSCRYLLSMMNGKINFTSSDNGTTFQVELPIYLP